VVVWGVAGAIRQWVDVQDRLPARVEAVCRDDVAGEAGRLIRAAAGATLERVFDVDLITVAIHSLREIAAPFGLGRHADQPRAAGPQLLVVFLVDEKEELVFLLIELQPRQSDRPAEVPADVVVAIKRTPEALRIVEEVVGVQPFVAVKEARAALIPLRAAPPDELNEAAPRLAELGLIVRGQNLDFADRIGVDRHVACAVASCINGGGAVNRQLFLIATRAVDVERVQAPWPRNLPVEIADYAGQNLHQV